MRMLHLDHSSELITYVNRNEFMDHGYVTCAKLNNIYKHLLNFLQWKQMQNIYRYHQHLMPKNIS
jgi:hypothetical protein